MLERLKSFDPYKVFQSLLGLILLEGVLAIFFYFRIPSESQNVFWGGYSFQRLVIGIFLLAILVVFIALFIISMRFKERLQQIGLKAASTLASYPYRMGILTPLWLVVAAITLYIALYAFPVLYNFMHFVVISNNLVERTGLIQLWIVLIILKFLLFYALFGQAKSLQENLSLPFKLTFVTWVLSVSMLALTILWGASIGSISQVISGPVGKCFIVAIWFSLWLMIYKKNEGWATRHHTFFRAMSVWLITFLVSFQIGQWMGTINRPVNNNWNFLADAFLHGRLFLLDTQAKFDLTLHAGNWYVPIPPLPAFILMPFIAIWGVDSFNTTIFSLALAATIATFLFLILDELSNLGWIKLSRSNVIWLVALLAFGTVQLWLSVLSTMWWFSQICTQLLIALAFLLAVKRRSPWLVGLALGLALMGRPNVFVLWPALVAIAAQFQSSSGETFSRKKLFAWAAQSAIPVFLAVGLLLYYNFLRFGNFLDFGYVTINGSPDVVARAKQFGIFNPIFIQTNINTMFLALPYLTTGCDYYFPRSGGMSLIATTPAFLYILRRFKFSWWTLGCWVSVLLSVCLLAMYHNNGTLQYGYRYVLDFSIPLIMLIAFNAGERPSWLLKGLVVLSVIINYYGVVSWFRGPC